MDLRKISISVLILLLGAFLMLGCGEEEAETNGTLPFTLTSTSITSGAAISVKYAHSPVTGAQNVSPQLSWSNVPNGTKSFAIIMIDKSQTSWKHWQVINISGEATSIAEGASQSGMPSGSTQLFNSFETSTSGVYERGYGGPAPPQSASAHTYEITVYALNKTISLADTTTNTDFLNAVSINLGSAKISGTFAW